MRARVIGWKGELGRAKPARDGFQYLETRDGSLRTIYHADVCDIHGRVTGNVGRAAKTDLSHWLVSRGAEPQ